MYAYFISENIPQTFMKLDIFESAPKMF